MPNPRENWLLSVGFLSVDHVAPRCVPGLLQTNRLHFSSSVQILDSLRRAVELAGGGNSGMCQSSLEILNFWTLELSHGLDCCLQLRNSDACCFEHGLWHLCPIRLSGCLGLVLHTLQCRFDSNSGVAVLGIQRCQCRFESLCCAVLCLRAPFLQRPLNCGLPGICAADELRTD